MKKIKIIISFIISIILIIYSFKNIEWSQFKESFSDAPVFAIILITGFNIVAAFLRAKRWQILLSNIGKVRFIHSFNYMNIGYLVNCIFPARAGEIVRPILLAKKVNKSKISVLTTVVVERLFDFVSLLVFLLYAASVVDLPVWMKKGGSLIVFLAFAALLFMFVLGKNEELLNKIINILSFKKIKIQNFLKPKVQNILQAIKILTRFRDILYVLFLSAGIWIIYAASTFVLISALNLNIDEFNAAIIVLVFVSFAMVIPATPGYIGTYQMAIILALGIFGVSKTEALVISFLFQVPLYVLNVSLGIFSLWWEGLNFKLLGKTTESQRNLDGDKIPLE